MRAGKGEGRQHDAGAQALLLAPSLAPSSPNPPRHPRGERAAVKPPHRCRSPAAGRHGQRRGQERGVDSPWPRGARCGQGAEVTQRHDSASKPVGFLF